MSSPEIDAGLIVYQALFDIETATALSLTAKCTRAGVRLVQQLLETAAVDPKAFPRIPQDLAKREYFGAETPRTVDSHGHVPRVTWSTSCGHATYFLFAHLGLSPNQDWRARNRYRQSLPERTARHGAGDRRSESRIGHACGMRR
jgi:hypothetical protein